MSALTANGGASWPGDRGAGAISRRVLHLVNWADKDLSPTAIPLFLDDL